MSLPTSPPSNSSAQEIRDRLRELLRERMGSTGSWYPLSHGQEALWFLWKLAPHSCAYNLVLPVRIVGDLDVDAFDRSLQKLSERHACLRTEFREEEGQPRQRPMPPQQHRLNLELVEASAWSAAQLDDAMRESARRPFDLEAGAALRVSLFRRSLVSHTLLIVIHHILADLWSLIILMDELRDVYMAEKGASAAGLSPLPLRYEDYVRWQRRMLDGEAGERLWEYWRGELAGELPALDLPTDHTRPSVQSFRGGTITRRLDAGLSGQLRLLAGAEESTLFMTLLAAYEVLLYRHTGQEKMFVGTPVSGRSRAELNGVFGDFVNIVPLRVDLSADITFRQLLGQARRRVLGAISHQDYPFSLMVDRLQPTRDLSRPPIFQTSFVLQKFHRFEEFSRAILPGEDEPAIPFGDLMLEPLPFAQQDGQFDLNLEMKEDEGGRLVAAWKYSADLFEADTIARMAAQFETLLGEIVADPGRRISELHLLSAEESARARASGEGERRELPAAASVYELFRSQVERSANAVAVLCGDDSLTYSELSGRVDDFAQALAELGVGTEVLVAVFLPRGLDFVATLLAVSKAGGAFLPLDPRHPSSRTGQILESSRVPLVLTSRDRREHASRALADLPEALRPRVVCVEELARAPQAGTSLPAVAERSLAYVLFTSGSTGRPKGVMVEHRGMVNHTLAKLSDLGIGAGDTLAQNGPQSFDIVVWQCLAPLAVGGRVAVFTDEVAEDPALLVDEVNERAVTVLQLVPSMMHAVLEHVTAHASERRKLAGLRCIVPTGDALPTELCRKWLELYPDIPLLNTYGSTECSDDQCHYRLDSLGPADESVAVASIGTPIHNLTAHVLDGNLTPVPAGVVGELYIGGVGVGRGYLSDPARTAAAFVPDPLGDTPGARMYRTRDLARRRADGNLNFLGRLDHMIKLRGFRIEPKEIEAALCRHPSISEAAVLARSHPSGERRIVGYVVASRGRGGEEGAAAGGDGVPGVEELQRHLADSLPHYMIPAAFCFVDSLPLNSNGKLDSNQLPDPEWQAISAEQFVAPRTAAEEKMERIWAEVLGREGVSVTENFFAVGGDSIRSIQIVARCKQAGMHVTPGDIFLHPTVAALTTLAEKNAGERSGMIPDVAGEGEAAGGSPSATALYVSREHLELALGQVVLDEE